MELKEGDNITRYSNYGVLSIHPIERITKTQILIKVLGREIKLQNQVAVGGNLWQLARPKYSTEMFRVARESDYDEAKYKQAIDTITATNFAKLDKEIIFKIFELIS